MNVYTCNQFTGHWPVGAAAVIVAESQESALVELNGALLKEGLKGDAKLQDLLLLSQTEPTVVILHDGNY